MLNPHVARANTCTVVQSSVDRPFAASYRRAYPLTLERKKIMSNSQDQLVQILKRSQITANSCASFFTTGQLKVELRVAFCTGAILPWRLLEIHRAAKAAGKPRLLRRKHCFRSGESMEHSIEERTNWKARDQALVQGHWIRVRALTGKAPSSKPAARASESSHSDLQALTATRQALRAKRCSTRPDRVVDLPNR